MTPGARFLDAIGAEPVAPWPSPVPPVGQDRSGASGSTGPGMVAVAALLALVAAQLLAGFWGIGALSVLWGQDVPDPRPVWSLPVVNMGLWIGYLAAPLLVSRWVGGATRPDLQLRAPGRLLTTSLIIGVATQILVLPALYWPILRLVDDDPGASARELVDRVDGPVDLVALLISVVVAAPLIEEWFYRGLLLPALSRPLGVVVGAVITSLIFAAVHGQLILIPGLFVFALVAAWLTSTTGSLGPAVAAHVGFNLSTLLLLLRA